MLSRIAKAILKAPIIVYRYSLKGLIGWECRHLPTCSEYGLDSIEKNGAWKGFWLTVSRVSRCRPGGTHGFDPAPDLREVRYPIWLAWKYGVWGKLKDRE